MPFYHPIASYYNEIFPLRPPKLSFIKSYLRETPSHILDIGCATGQLALTLAAEGHRVEGIDLDSQMIEIARNEASTKNIPPRFAVLDMTRVDEYFKNQKFDVISCLGNTLVHLPGLPEVEAFYKKIHQILAPGGVFVVQIVNYEAVLAHGVKSLPDLDTPHVRFQRSYAYDEKHHKIKFSSTLTVKETAETIRDEVMLYPLTQAELKSIIPPSSKIQFYGNFQKELYNINSQALIIASGGQNPFYKKGSGLPKIFG